MPSTHHTLDWAGPPSLTLHLMAGKAVYWPAQRTLFVADLHIGKAAVFRARGLPVPQGTTTDTLTRLSHAVRASGAERLVVLGDLLHARESHAEPTMTALRRWRLDHASLACTALEGNHDRHAGLLDAALGFEAVRDVYDAGPLLGVHDPADAADRPRRDAGSTAPEPPDRRLVLAGHLHPVATLRGRLDQLRLPCFWLHQGVLTLPAFGAFTGGHALTLRRGHIVHGQAFAVAGDAVLPLPSMGIAAPR
jgi:DNA ligase-associated metallophosphoesterase